LFNDRLSVSVLQDHYSGEISLVLLFSHENTKTQKAERLCPGWPGGHACVEPATVM
jgi:hypothetical protein